MLYAVCGDSCDIVEWGRKKNLTELWIFEENILIQYGCSQCSL